MTDGEIETTITGGQIQGIAGAGSVVIENFTIYNCAVEEPAAAATEPISPCPYPGLAYFGPDDADLFFGRDAAIARLAGAVGLPISSRKPSRWSRMRRSAFASSMCCWRASLIRHWAASPTSA